ncbi:LamG-like jellyroll fold domain-containing protein [Allorhodopirellula solitaria]|uniref:FecR protein n=1 Tax=Allorhodopirellula solitaria TaxID=2527987 RepID=A0A5C5YJM7_9BACT|nr:LamG-like jellyroll fold domain-containing protein [Allorhodopirellula solitaria]TWT75027.1 FecR protein [Allorhodopirellula solitaria]
MNVESHEDVGVLVDVMLDGTLTDTQKAELNRLLKTSPRALTRYHELLDNHEALCAIYPGDVYAESIDDESLSSASQNSPAGLTWWMGLLNASRGSQFAVLATAASLLVAVGLAGYFAGADRRELRLGELSTVAFEPETTLEGHAILRRSLSLRWTEGEPGFRSGDILPAGRLKIESGIAEIDFFCGATLTVEGPASLVVQSDWGVRVDSGRLRASVPPAARGFVIETADAEVVDLGTEFALDVDSEGAFVDVIEGEVALRGGRHDGVHLVTGQQSWLGGLETKSLAATSQRNAVSSVADVERRREAALAERFAQWQSFSKSREQDERLIAHYRIADMPSSRTIPDSASTGKDQDAALIGPVDRTVGRFGPLSSGLEFDRVGARARTRIEGEFEAFTFATWVRIDSLDQVYNALFMSDGYENGELHWQIRDDGVMMFSVMVDDTQKRKHFSDRDGTIVSSAGLHRVYYTEPIWDIAQSGRWFHLSAVYDPAERRVTQYVNGQQVSSEPIQEKFFVDRLRIGPAEIGNWGQPFRKTPWFSVRNLNGTIDELVIYNAALSEEEIQSLYEKGKPLGY